MKFTMVLKCGRPFLIFNTTYLSNVTYELLCVYIIYMYIIIYIFGTIIKKSNLAFHLLEVWA